MSSDVSEINCFDITINFVDGPMIIPLEKVWT